MTQSKTHTYNLEYASAYFKHQMVFCINIFTFRTAEKPKLALSQKLSVSKQMFCVLFTRRQVHRFRLKCYFHCSIYL